MIFHRDVIFVGRPTFNKDTAGHAFVKAGNNEVDIVFNKEYGQNPVVTTNVNLNGSIKIDEIPPYAVYDLSTKGFKIRLSYATPHDLSFSWVALFVDKENEPDHSVLNIIQEITPSPTPSESASPSANTKD